MASQPLPEHLVAVVVSPDADFRRLAGAALSRAGHDVHTASATPKRLERLVRLRRPNVVVLDVSMDRDIPSLDRGTAAQPGPVVVLVADTPSPGVVDKWGPLEALLEAIEAAGRTRPRLRVVS